MAENKKALSNEQLLNAVYPANLKWDIDIPNTDLVSLIEEAIKENADKTCIDFMGKKYSYAEVGALIDKAANGFKKQNIGKDSKVGLFMPNTPYHAIMFFGALKAGATVVNYDSLYDVPSLERQIKDSGTTLMVTVDNPEFYPKVKSLIKSGNLEKAVICPMDHILKGGLGLGYDVLNFKTVLKARLSNLFNCKSTGYKKLISSKLKSTFTKSSPKDLAVLQYTGGTTGVSKGAMLTHENLVANATQVLKYMSVEPGEANSDKMFERGKDKMMAVLPYFHIFGMTVSLVSSMRMGAELVILPNPRDIDQIFKTIEDKKVNVVPVVPRLLRAMIDYPERDKYDFSSVKLFMSGGAALSPDLKAEFEQVFKIPVIQGYGLTETAPVACVQHPLEAKNDPNSVGFAVPKTEIMIASVDDQDKLIPVNEGETGEICIKGPQVMKGYWQKEEETKKVLSGAWFKSGDVGHIGKNGQLYITDRIKDMGLINGKNIYAVPIEKEIQNHQDIVECNIVFVKDPRSGEAAVAYIRPKQTKTYSFLAS
jgi:long-chain acyl-CoA synthetase